MTTTIDKASFRPLNGESVRKLKIIDVENEPTLSFRWRAMEMGYYERAKTATVEEFPGVYRINLFSAPLQSTGNEPIPLEVAEKKDTLPALFLISKLGNLAVVTSRLGYGSATPVRVPEIPDWYTGNRPVGGFDLYDSSYFNYSVLDKHVERVREFGGSPDLALPASIGDSIFRQMLSGVTEADN